MCDKYAVTYFSMTFYTSYTRKMGLFVWQPVVTFNNYNLLSIGQQLKILKICMTLETYIIIIYYCLFKVCRISDIDFITVGIMAFPAGESLYCSMCTFFIFLTNLFKLILCVLLIISMTIITTIWFFKPDRCWMRKNFEVIRMTVGAGKTPVVRLIIFIPVDMIILPHKSILCNT